MIEITDKIDSIRNMKNDLNSIKLMSQKNADKMLQHLADFRHRICSEMSKIENSDYNESEDSKRMSEMLLKWENCSLMGTDVTANLPSTHNGSTVSRNNQERNSSVDTLDSITTPDEVNILFSKQLPYTTPDSPPIEKGVRNHTPSDPVKDQLGNEIFQNDNNPMTKDKADKLTKKLKELQTQNEELRNVNENIQNLLLKLGDLKYADPADVETVDKLDAIKKESQMSSDDSHHIPETSPETIMKTESHQQFTRSVEITSSKQFVRRRS